MLTIKPLFFIFALITLLLGGCFDEAYEEISQKRAKLVVNVKNPIIIGIAWDSHHTSFLKGVKLAVKLINADGGVLNRPLEIIVNKDEDKLLDLTLSTNEYQTIVLNIANSFADNHKVVAVIGHVTSKTALLASVIYENKGLLFFNTECD
ncbi:MAG: hypothetical protein Q9M50_12220 [Methylococcales bacterium]|nr:hypothetical protein [Methylococcales bacterium]